MRLPKLTRRKIVLLSMLCVPVMKGRALTTKTWTGATNNDFNTSTNWSPAGAPGASDSCVITVTSDKTISLSAHTTVGALYMFANGNNVNLYVDCVNKLLTVQGNLHMKASGNSNTDVQLDLGSNAGGLTVMRHSVIDDGGNASALVRADATNGGIYTLYGNLTIGANGRTTPTYEPDMIFDKNGTQTITANNTVTYFLAEDLTIGSANNPTVNLSSTLTVAFGVYDGSVTMNGSSVFDLGSSTCDRFSSGGSFIMNSTSYLKIGGSGDFPASYTTYTLANTSTVEFNGSGTTQSVNTRSGVDSYGNLVIGGSGSKENSNSSGILVNGTMTVNSGATYYAYWEQNTFAGNVVINGTFNASDDIQTFKGNFENNGTYSYSALSTATASFEGTEPQTVQGSVSTSFYNMTINNSSSTGVTLSKTTNIDKLLTLTDGYLYSSSSNLLVLNDNVTVSGGSATSYVSGPIRKVGNDAFVFPTGKNGVYARIGITAPSNTADHFTAEYNNSAYSTLTPVAATLAYVSDVEHWILDRTNGSSNVSVTLYWENGTNSGINSVSSDLHIARFDGTTWQDHGSGTLTGTTSAGTVQTSGAVTSFSPFAFASVTSSRGTNPLPVTLTKFDANCKPNGGLALNWETESEINSKDFNVRRSYDGMDFQTIATVHAAGNSATLKAYEVTDYPEKEQVYYSLSQVDINGYVKEFVPISANCALKQCTSFNAYQGLNGVVLNVSDQMETRMRVDIMDVSGRVMYSEFIEHPGGTSKTTVAGFMQFPKGVYFLRLSGGTDTKIVKAVF